MNKVFKKTSESGLSLRSSCHKLKQPFSKTTIGQNDLSFSLLLVRGIKSQNNLIEQLASTHSNITLKKAI